MSVSNTTKKTLLSTVIVAQKKTLDLPNRSTDRPRKPNVSIPQLFLLTPQRNNKAGGGRREEAARKRRQSDEGDVFVSKFERASERAAGEEGEKRSDRARGSFVCLFFVCLSVSLSSSKKKKKKALVAKTQPRSTEVASSLRDFD